MGRDQFEKLHTCILLVEDDPDHADLAVRALEKSGTADRVVVARDGEQALEHLFGNHHAESPAVVFLDLKLPRMSGFEVLRRIRENEATRFLPVVVLSSSDEDADLARSYELGVNSYILKPVSFTDFVEVTRQMGTYWLLLNQTPLQKRLASNGAVSLETSGFLPGFHDMDEKDSAAQDSRKGVEGVRSGRGEERKEAS
jgi:CheY-like chemotaxis protein